MSTDLRKVVEDPQRRPLVIKDCAALVDSEVKSKSGLSGVAVKTAYSVVKAIKPGFIEAAIDGLLDEWAEELQQFCQRHQDEGSSEPLERYLEARAADVAEGLLSVTDRRADRSNAKAAVKAYHKLRPKGKAHVQMAVPGLGRLLDKHLQA